jgi:hypothetical protein
MSHHAAALQRHTAVVNVIAVVHYVTPCCTTVTHAQVKAAAFDAQSPNVAVVLLQLLQRRREIAAAAAQWPK